MTSFFNGRVPVFSFLLAAVVLVFTASAYGQNLLTNPDLSTNSSGWTISGTGSAPYQSTLGSPTPGSVSLIANAAGQAETMSQCVALTASTIDFGMRQYAQFGNVGSTVQLTATFFSAAGCTGSTLGTLTASQVTPMTPDSTSVPPNWFDARSTGVATPGGTQSVRIDFTISQTGAGVTNYGADHFVVGPAGAWAASFSSAAVPAVSKLGLLLMLATLAMIGVLLARH